MKDSNHFHQMDHVYIFIWTASRNKWVLTVQNALFGNFSIFLLFHIEVHELYHLL